MTNPLCQWAGAWWCRYVKGDFRFRKGYSKSNPRKMVKVWAEKEMRNLVRLAAAGIRCPRAHLLQMHVLVMSFIGTGAVAAPRLKDAQLPLVPPPPLPLSLFSPLITLS